MVVVKKIYLQDHSLKLITKALRIMQSIFYLVILKPANQKEKDEEERERRITHKEGNNFNIDRLGKGFV